jgi:hypothetical protein
LTVPYIKLDSVLSKSDSISILNITNLVANNYAQRYSHDIDSISRYYVKEIDSLKARPCACDSATVKQSSLIIIEYGTPVLALIFSYLGGYLGAHK